MLLHGSDKRTSRNKKCSLIQLKRFFIWVGWCDRSLGPQRSWNSTIYVYGMLSKIVVQTLKWVTHPDLIKLKTKYAACKYIVEDFNRSRDASRSITEACTNNFIETLLLQSLCIMGEIKDALTIEDATDASVITWFDGAISAVPREIAELIRVALDSVSYVQWPIDTSGAVQTFLPNNIQSLENNNASEVEKQRVMQRAHWRTSSEARATERHERIRDAREYWTRKKKAYISFS